MGKGIKKVILILAPGHSGSTLLDMVISSAEDFIGVGEVYALRKEKYRQKLIPACSIHEFDCEFWTDVRRRKVEKLLHHNRIKRVIFSVINYKYRLYNYLLNQSGSRVIVDSSKYPEWVAHSIKNLEKSNLKPYLIYLNRDPRAIINSWMRKYPEKSIESIIREHKENVIKIEQVYNNAAIAKIKVQYENLTSSTEQMFTSIFDFMEEEYKPNYLEYWKYTHHQIGGNSGTKSIVKKYQGNLSESELGSHTSQYYQGHRFEIKKDERWRQELSEEHKELIINEFNWDEDYLSS